MLRFALSALSFLLILPAAAQSRLRVAGPPVAVTDVRDGPFVGPVWSPDGSRIAFGGAGYSGLWIVNPDGSSLTRISAEPAAGFGFSWSQDGSAIVARVARDEDGRRSHAVVVLDVATGRPSSLTDFRAAMPSIPVWAPGTADVVLPGPDGLERLDAGLPESARKTGSADRFFLIRDGRPVDADAVAGRVRPLDLFPGETLLNLAVAPDGRRVAFEVLGGDCYVLDGPGATPVNVGSGHRPRFSPDGRWIVFMVTEDDGERFLSSDLVAVRSDGSLSVRLTSTPDRLEMNPSWSPDGRRIAYDDLQDGVIYLLPITE